jgi:peptidoglycan/xylan/chitin deacetylase (PgdA/CDA1 family)
VQSASVLAGILCFFALLFNSCGDDVGAPLARVVEHGAGDRREIALTFDAGVGGSTDPQSVAEILRVLRERNVRATFSLTGLWAETNRDLLFTIAADGHQIINGTYASESWAGLSAEDRKLALTRTEVTVYRYTSRSTLPYVRPPEGEVDESVRRDAAANGYDAIVLSSIRLVLPESRASLASDVADAAEPGAIVELGIEGTEAQNLGRMVDELRRDGYALVTIDALLAP